MLFKVKGILDFTPPDVSKKHSLQSEWKCTAIVRTNCDTSAYYRWFLKNRFNLVLNPPLRGTHVTFVADRMDRNLFMDVAKIFNGKEVTFYYQHMPRSNGKHWWLRVWSPELESIREVMGLSREPYLGMHLTIGSANEKNIKHSEYITWCCQAFNILSSEPRKSLDEYEIYGEG